MATDLTPDALATARGSQPGVSPQVRSWLGAATDSGGSAIGGDGGNGGSPGGAGGAGGYGTNGFGASGQPG